MSYCQSFDAIEPAEMRVLVLGSMPGVASLQQQAYYAHPRNAFWPIMAELLNHQAWSSDFQARYQILQQHHIGLWDVLAECVRPGSLDSAIQTDSIQVNDIPGLVSRHPECKLIVLNGGKASELFKRHILSLNKALFGELEIATLPSTSPANARLNLQQKTDIWRDKLANFL